MSYKKQTYEWDIPISQVLSGQTVGFEIQLSQDPNFNKIYSHFNTFEEHFLGVEGRLLFSIDDGETWNNFEMLNGDGETFTSAFKLKFEVFALDVECIYAIRDNIIYRLSPDGESILNKIDVSTIGNCISFEYNSLKTALCLTSEKTTMFRISTEGGLSNYNKSININGVPLAIAIDDARNSFWQINQDKVCLKQWNGDVIFCLDNPLSELIDVDYSSSSSLSSLSSYSSDSSPSSTSSSESSLSSPSSTSSSSSSPSSESVGNISSSSSTESVNNFSSSSTESVNNFSSSSTESVNNFSSSSSSESSPSSISSESSTSSEALNGVRGVGVNWEAENTTPDYDFNDLSMVIYGQSNCRFSLRHNGVDSNNEIARKIRVSTAGPAQMTGASNTFPPQRITMYLNGVNVFDEGAIYYGQNFSYHFATLNVNDLIEIRLRNYDGLDIYSHQIHSDGRIRARTTIAY